MPTEQQPQTPPAQPFEGMPEPEAGHEAEQHYKTLAFKLEEGAHAQLHFIAQLRGSNAAKEARLAIQTHLTNAQQDPELIARAEQARQAIEREAAARAAAIAGFMGSATLADEVSGVPAGTSRKSRRGTAPTNQSNK